jgi:hypothetical protein
MAKLAACKTRGCDKSRYYKSKVFCEAHYTEYCKMRDDKVNAYVAANRQRQQMEQEVHDVDFSE